MYSSTFLIHTYIQKFIHTSPASKVSWVTTAKSLQLFLMLGSGALLYLFQRHSVFLISHYIYTFVHSYIHTYMASVMMLMENRMLVRERYSTREFGCLRQGITTDTPTDSSAAVYIQVCTSVCITANIQKSNRRTDSKTKFPSTVFHPVSPTIIKIRHSKG